jgi:hypothetical protein
MAVPMTYDSLIEQIKQYANRTDDFFTSIIPDLINFAINRIYSEAKNIGFERVFESNALLNANRPFIAKPNDWKETISFQYTVTGATPETRFLLQRTYEFCISYWPNTPQTGEPIFYANYGNQDINTVNQGQSFDQFYITPTPDKDYPGKIIYLGLPQFDKDSQTNFLTQRYPNLLLYACMMEAIPFLGDDERTPIFENLYNRALQNINRDTTERYTDRVTAKEKD